MTASADLAITKTGPATVVAGSLVSYSLVVVDNGPSDAANLTVTDTLPAGVTFVSATGAGWTCSNAGNVSATCTRPALATGVTAPTITVVVTAPAQGATLTDTATVAATTSDPVPGNNSSSVTTTVTPSADLAITKTGPATVVAGASVTYQLVVTDNGPSDADGGVGDGHAPGRRDVRVRRRHRLGVHQQRERLGHLHPPDARDRGDGADDHGRRHRARPRARP